jgi:RNA polymerase sigma factor (sigma-70 family)
MGSDASLDAASIDIGKLGLRLRYRVCREVGFACPDVDDLVQETLKRYLDAQRDHKMRTPEAVGAFINGICRNVINEYRRRLFRSSPLPDDPPEPPSRGIPPSDLLELRDALSDALNQLSERDRQVLRAFYLEERPVEEILRVTGLAAGNFRVVLCRAKERFRQIYLGSVKSRHASGH